jgi:hypothetical protein
MLVMNLAGFAVAIAALTSCAGGGNIEGSASPITLSKPTAYVSTDSHEVSCAPGDPQSDGDETESGTLIEPANR